MGKQPPRTRYTKPVGGKKAESGVVGSGASRLREQFRINEGWAEKEKSFLGVIEGAETKLVGSSIKEAMKRANLDVEREYNSCGRLCGRLTDGRRFSFRTLGRLIR
jgi:hypothetical protein